MDFSSVTYAAHQNDDPAYRALTHLGVALQDLITANGLREPITRHMRVEAVCGREPACATANSVSVFTCGTIAYPSRYFRFIQADNREKLIGHMPLWARSSRYQVALNPKADQQRIDKQTEKNCFEIALLDLHRTFGGYHSPRRRRPKWATGHRMHTQREDFIGTC